jgi:hypothetical protein
MSGMAMKIQEHMQIVGSCGNPVGKVDKVEGENIKLTKDSDPHGMGHHHTLPLSAVKSVEGDKVMLSMNSMEAKQQLAKTAG